MVTKTDVTVNNQLTNTVSTNVSSQAQGKNVSGREVKSEPIQKIPNELLLKIFSYLPPSDIRNNIRGVCKNWNEVSYIEDLWKNLLSLSEDELKALKKKTAIENSRISFAEQVWKEITQKAFLKKQQEETYYQMGVKKCVENIEAGEDMQDIIDASHFSASGLNSKEDFVKVVNERWMLIDIGKKEFEKSKTLEQDLFRKIWQVFSRK